MSQHTSIVYVISLGHLSLYNGNLPLSLRGRCRRIRLKYQPAKLICCHWNPKETACPYNCIDNYPGHFLYYFSTGLKVALAIVSLLLCVAVTVLGFKFWKAHQARPDGHWWRPMLQEWTFSPINKTLMPVLDLQWSLRVRVDMCLYLPFKN